MAAIIIIINIFAIIALAESCVCQGGDLYSIWAEPPIQPLLKVSHYSHTFSLIFRSLPSHVQCSRQNLTMFHVLNKHEICHLLLKYGKRTIDSFAGLCLQCDQLCQLACWERGVKSGRGRAVCLQVCTRDGYSDDDLRMLMADAKEKISRCLPNQGDMVAD